MIDMQDWTVGEGAGGRKRELGVIKMEMVLKAM